jgi:hypothetical protein
MTGTWAQHPGSGRRILVTRHSCATASAAGHDVSSIKRALVSGAAFPTSLQEEIKSCGVDADQAFGTADLGPIAFETPAREGMVVNEDLILEIVRPGTGDPVAAGDGRVDQHVQPPFGRVGVLLRRSRNADRSAAFGYDAQEKARKRRDGYRVAVQQRANVDFSDRPEVANNTGDQ